MAFRNTISKFGLTLFHRYNDALHAHPIRTKMITSGIISFIGDTICQKLIEKKSAKEHSFIRTARQASVSCFYTAPVGHVWFMSLLPMMLGPFKKRGIRIAASVVLDNTIYSSYSIITGVLLMEFLKNGQLNEAWHNVIEKFPRIFLRSMEYWCIMSLIMHTFLPNHYKVLMGNVAGIIWQIYLSYSVNAEKSPVVEVAPEPLDEVSNGLTVAEI